LTLDNDSFLDPWQFTNSEKFILELRKEVCIEHVLYNKKLKIIARRCDRDEYLFQLIDEGKFAQVHLTWRGSVEPDPLWPATALFDSFDIWVEKVMKQDHLKYGDI